MQHNTCPGVDKPWSVLTFGCWQIAPSAGWGDVCTPAEADAAVKAALDSGITAFDTAEGYGDGESERRLGKALGRRKDEVVIISKIWPDAALSPESYAEHLEDTLRALGRDYVDVYLIHWPGGYFDSAEKSARLTECMQSLKESGKAKTVGLSNFHERDLRLLGDGLKTYSVNQVPYSLLERRYEGETRALCKEAGLGYMAFSPTAQGLLAGRLGKEAQDFPVRRNNKFYNEPLHTPAMEVYETVREIASELSRNPIEVALAWVIAQENILTAVVGSRKAEQIEEFAPAGDLVLSHQHLDRLKEASDRFQKVMV